MPKLPALFRIVVRGFLTVALFSCSQSPGPSTYSKVIGRYVAHYDAERGTVDYTPLQAANKIKGEKGLRSSIHGLLDYTDTTGLTGSTVDPYGCAIRDYSKTVGEINWCMALLDPDSCGVDYNSTTHVLSFYAKLVNKSDTAENATTFHYTDTTNFPQNTTFFAPFLFKLSGLEWDFGTYPELITAVNTNIVSAECGANGLTLTSDDLNANHKFDCIYPEQDYNENDTPVDPGWDFSPYVADGVMSPGEDTGCTLFMQYTLTQNQSFYIYFDLLAAKSDGTPPATPTVSSPASGSYVNTTPVTVTGTCTANTGTVYVEGGSSTTPPSVACAGNGTFSLDVPLKSNQANNLVIYQIVGGEQSQPAIVVVTHDNIAPSVVSWVPADGETVVGVNQPCIATFSEAMDTTTFNEGTGTNNNSCDRLNFGLCRSSGNRRIAGTIAFSSDRTQASYTPSSALANSTLYTCNAKVASGSPTTLKDLAGNALSPTSTVSFTSGVSGQDLTKPYVKNIYPSDNSTISRSSSIYVYFSEPVTSSSLTATNCSSNGSIPNLAVWQTNSCVTSGYPTPRPNAISGTTSLNLAGDIATFTPSTAFSADDCLAVTVSSCVQDLSGNTLPNRGSFSIGAYNDTLQYNSWNIFYTLPTSDSTAPNVRHFGPVINNASTSRQVYPFVVFDEPMDASTIVTDYIYLTVFGNPAKISGSLAIDSSLQRVTFKPSAAIAGSTQHVLTVTGNVSDTSGVLMSAPQTSNFTTVSALDSTAPTVLSVSPSNGSSASRCNKVTVQFSEAMDTSTLHGANVQLIRTSTGLPVATDLSISDNDQTVVITPEASLTSGATYRPTISGVKDRAGNSIAATYNATTFTAATDSTAPTVSSFVPAGGSTVAQNGSFAVFFSEAMDQSTLTNGNFSFGGLCSFQSVFPSTDGTWAVVNCYHNMTAGSGRTLTLSGASIKDRYVSTDGGNCENNGGNAIGTSPSITFTVSGTSDTTAPTVSSVSPTDLSTSVSTGIAPTITFSEAIDPRTISPTTVFLTDSTGNIINTTISFNSTATAITLTPVTALSNPGIYYIIATTALRDLGGGNAYDGNGGESSSVSGILRTCFSTSGTSCP